MKSMKRHRSKMNFVYKALRVDRYNYDEKRKRISMILLVFFMCLFWLVLMITFLLKKDYLSVAVFGSSMFCLILSTILFIIFQFFETYIFLVAFVGFATIIYSHYSKPGGILYSSSVACLALFPFIFYHLSSYLLHQLFWTIVVIFTLFSCIIAEFFYTDLSYVLSEVENNLVVLLIKHYIAKYLTISGVLFISLYLVIKENKRRGVIEEIAKGICELDLDSKGLKKLQDKGVSQCTNLEKLFKIIVKNVNEYKKYLPASLYGCNREIRSSSIKRSKKSALEKKKSKKKNKKNRIVPVSVNEKEEEVFLPDDGKHKRIDSKSSSRRVKSLSIAQHLTFSSILSYITTSTKSSSIDGSMNESSIYDDLDSMSSFDTDGGGKGERVYEGGQLIEKNVTFLLCNFVNFHVCMKLYTPKRLAELHSIYVDRMSRIIVCHGGIVDGFFGDKILGSFNSVKKCYNHCEKACSTALKMTEEIQKKLNVDLESKKFQPIQVRITIVCDTFLSGNIGTDKIKRYTTFGSGINLMYELDKFGKKYNSDDSIMGGEHLDIIVDDKVQHDINKFKFQTKLIDYVQLDYLKTVNENIIRKVYSLISQTQCKENDEWMYQISSQISPDDKNEQNEKDYMDAWKYFKDNNIPLAKITIEKYLEKNIKDYYAKYMLKKINNVQPNYITQMV